MKVNILETGSAGNCVVATFSDNRKIIFDFGHNAWKLCCAAKIDFHEVDNILVTHEHLDHCADFSRVRFLAFPRWCEFIEFPVLHNAPNKGFIVFNKNTKESFVYATDYYQIPAESLDKIKACVGFKDWRWIVMLELSYCRFVYNKLDHIQTIGLNNHCSDERFFEYAKQILDVNQAVNIISMHASARQGQFELGANRVSDVCPPDWVREQMFTRFKGKSVRFGLASGMFGTYNYIERRAE